MPTITLVSTRISDTRLRALAQLLDANEQARLQRLRQPDDKRRYIVAHAGLRGLLADRLGVSAVSLRFSENAHGKPCLAGLLAHGPHFNLSHSAELVAIAIADVAIGIDIEHEGAIIDCGMMDLAFTDEEKRRGRSNADRLQIWTAKESVIKACGRGMSLPLLTFSAPPASNSFQLITPHGPDLCLNEQRVANFEALPGYHGAVSILGPALPIVVQTLDAEKAFL
jgi:4'-phosphopantetheinyl transferase